MKRLFCAICENNIINNIFILNNMPISLYCTDVNKNFEYNELSFSQCNYCNTIQLDKLIDLNKLYEKSHNFTSVGNIWHNYFKLFVEKIQKLTNNKIVLEIGDGSGKIALNINNYSSWYIVEPNKNPNVNFNKNKNIYFIEKFFDETFNIDKKIDIIVHSHLFEHIYEPNIFIRKCYEVLNENGEMFFGVPNMSYLADNITPFLGIFFEHTIFLNKENIEYLLEKNNFKLIEIIDYEKHSTIYHCIKLPINNNIFCERKTQKFLNYYDTFMNTLSNFKIFIKECNDIISTTNKSVYIFGASYNTQIIINLGLNINNIKGILDNCKEKQNKYLYGINLNIYDPSVIENEECIIILKNGYYINEIIEQLHHLNNNVQIIN